MQQPTAVPRTSGNVPWLLCPDLHSPRAFSISQWKSELLPSLGFFSKDRYLPVGAGCPGHGKHGVSLSWKMETRDGWKHL